MSLIEIGELYNVSVTAVNNIESRAFRNIRKSPWGIEKAKEIYLYKSSKYICIIPGTVEIINFTERYLCDKVIL